MEVRRAGMVNAGLMVAIILASLAASGFMIFDKVSRRKPLPVRQASAARSVDEANTLPIDDAPPFQEELEPLSPDQPAEPAPSPSAHASRQHAGLPATIARLPKSAREMASAFDRAAGFTCDILPAGNPIALTSFVPYSATLGGQPVSVPTLRHYALSIGLDVAQQDRSGLPTLSGQTILSYLNEHYVNVQVRIAKDPVTETYFLLPTPVAGTANFSGATITADMQPAVQQAVRDFRSLGLLLDPNKAPTLDDMRTLVLVQKYLSVPGRSGPPQEHYEFVFVRLRNDGRRLALHTFVTSHDRTKLNYLGNAARPRSLRDCNIQAHVVFDKYTHASLIPARGLIRESAVNARRTYEISDLEHYVQASNWSGDVWDHIPALLDAAIAKTVKE